MPLIKDGQTVKTVGVGIPCTAEQFLGGGGQGEVYKADLGGQKVALKWYFPVQATAEQRKALEILIKMGTPNDKFLWPLDLAISDTLSGFGYIMPLREARFKGIVDLMKRRIEPSFHALATAGLQLSDSYLVLHTKGLCYRDISFGNVFFDPDSGEALICDNDNVTINKSTQGGVLGTPRFMAPEIVRGEARPGTLTDLFSLSVLLFYMLMVHHPLEGAQEQAVHCLDLPAMTRIYGTDPVFIFDPTNDTNRPIPGYHNNVLAFWPLYPQFLRDLFTRAFTEGLHDPSDRVRESEWRNAMSRLRDAIFYCAHCGAENFYDANMTQAGICWACKSPLALPPRVNIEGTLVMLNHNTQLYPHHVDDDRMYDFRQPIAQMTQHPKNPDLWGLQNLSTEKWVLIPAGGAAMRDVPPGRSASIALGNRINFGKKLGEIF